MTRTMHAPGDRRPDLLDYRLVHRAMTVDFERLATAAEELASRPDRARMAELRRYLGAMTGEVVSHHHVEDAHVWPALTELAGDDVALAPLTADHEQLDPLLQLANELARSDEQISHLAGILHQVAHLLARHITDEERDLFPLIEARMDVPGYQELQRRFRANLRLRLLPFVVPWAVSHATAEERRSVLAEAPWPLRVLLAVFEPRFRRRQRRLFQPGGLSRRDRARVGLMRRISTVHSAVLRGTGGRVGSRWVGGADVILVTVRGRRSGRPHTVTLMCLADGDDLLVAASQGGVDREPQWWLNLLADPRAEVTQRGRRFAVTAQRVAAAERPRLWARFVAVYPGFDRYQAQVRREIAVVRLRPTGERSAAEIEDGATGSPGSR